VQPAYTANLQQIRVTRFEIKYLLFVMRGTLQLNNFGLLVAGLYARR
jgi:hypothetical protein